MIAGCGLKCVECPVFQATKTKNEKLRTQTAEKWSSYFDRQLKPEDLYCDGCKTKNGRLFGWCNECPVRLCVAKREIQSCAECGEYPCMDIEKIHEFNPQAKEEIEKIIKLKKR